MLLSPAASVHVRCVNMTRVAHFHHVNVSFFACHVQAVSALFFHYDPIYFHTTPDHPLYKVMTSSFVTFSPRQSWLDLLLSFVPHSCYDFRLSLSYRRNAEQVRLLYRNFKLASKISKSSSLYILLRICLIITGFSNCYKFPQSFESKLWNNHDPAWIKIK